MYKSAIVLVALVSMVVAYPTAGEDLFRLPRDADIKAEPISEEQMKGILQAPFEMAQAGANTVSGATSAAASAAASAFASTTSQVQGGIQNAYNTVQGDIQDTYHSVQGGVQNAVDSYRPSVNQFVSNIGQAFRVTVKQETESIRNTIQSIRAAGGQVLKAGVNSAKTGFDIFFALPKFAFNAVAGSKQRSLDDFEPK